MHKILFLFFTMFFLGCNREDERMSFEKRLNSLVGKTSNDVVEIFGNRPKYKNETRRDGVQCTFMTYNYDYSVVGTSYKCEIKFCIEQGRDRVLDYDYKGDGCF